MPWIIANTKMGVIFNIQNKERLSITKVFKLSIFLLDWSIEYFVFSVSLIFGIPTIKRERTSYLLDTLASLLDAMSQEDKDDCVIVIFVGEVNE